MAYQSTEERMDRLEEVLLSFIRNTDRASTGLKESQAALNQAELAASPS